MGWHHDWMNGMGGFMFPGLGLILVIVLVVVLIWAFSGARSFDRYPGPQGRDRGETPLEILKRRYAAGEIGKEEFDRMKKDLEG